LNLRPNRYERLALPLSYGLMATRAGGDRQRQGGRAHSRFGPTFRATKAALVLDGHRYRAGHAGVTNGTAATRQRGDDEVSGGVG
jgi:hypothetical protein